MAGYTALSGAVTNTDNVQMLYIANPATSPARMRLFEVLVGSKAAPADNAVNYEVCVFTDEHATPGGSAITPAPIDEDEPIARSNSVSGATGAVTGATVLIDLPHNMRATYRWVAQPGREFVCAATEDHGFLVRSDTPSTAFADHVTMFYEE